MASITGTVTTAGDPDDWIACAFDADTHAFGGMAAVSGGSYTISGLTAGTAYVVACRPKSGPVWAATRETDAGDYTVPTAPETTPYIYKATTAPPGDPSFADVSLLMHMDGSNGSTTFTDATGKTVTANGNAQISTAQSQFGGASGYFDGTGDYLAAPAAASLAFGSGAFTIEAWVYPTTLAGTKPIIECRSGGSSTSGYAFLVDSSGYLSVYVNGFLGTSSSALTANTWTHVALVRSGTGTNQTRYYINGIASGTITMSGNFTDANTSITRIGGSTTAGQFWVGYIDELRVTSGVARYTAGFTPPAAAFYDIAAPLTGTDEPTWSANPGDTVIDSDVTWTNMGRLIRPLMHGPLIAA